MVEGHKNRGNGRAESRQKSPHRKMIQKSMESCAWLIVARWTVAMDKPKSRSMSSIPVHAVIMDTNPKSWQDRKFGYRWYTSQPCDRHDSRACYYCHYNYYETTKTDRDIENGTRVNARLILTNAPRMVGLIPMQRVSPFYSPRPNYRSPFSRNRVVRSRYERARAERLNRFIAPLPNCCSRPDSP